MFRVRKDDRPTRWPKHVKAVIKETRIVNVLAIVTHLPNRARYVEGKSIPATYEIKFSERSEQLLGISNYVFASNTLEHAKKLLGDFLTKKNKELNAIFQVTTRPDRYMNVHSYDECSCDRDPKITEII